MSDPTTPEPTPEEVTPVTPATEHHPAKRGVTDAGEIVSTAGGELIDGRIADITDGDDNKHRHHK